MKPKTLSELQKYYQQKAEERGFEKETAQETLLLMTEELGELARAIRKNIGLKIDNKEKIYAIEEELADIQNYLLHLSSILGINLEEAYWKKEAENDTRKWK